MALRKLRPTSPGQRFVVRVVRDELHKGDPYEGLLEPLQRHGGRNNAGRVTVTRMPAKVKRFGTSTGKRQAWKKAYVRLAPGSDLNFMGAE